jgi:hypothetical protein
LVDEPPLSESVDMYKKSGFMFILSLCQREPDAHLLLRIRRSIHDYPFKTRKRRIRNKRLSFLANHLKQRGVCFKTQLLLFYIFTIGII